MAKASGVTQRQLRQIKSNAVATGNSSVVAFDSAARGARRFSASAAGATRSAGALRAQTANLSAQFQDIGVQLGSGTSPLQIALQQGTQISAVLGGQGATGAVTALRGAFASLISPVSLVTIGLIAAGGAAVQYFGSMLDGGEDSAEELKKQSDLIRQVAKDWGDAVPAIREYADELDRAARSANLLEAASAIQERIAADLKTQFRELTQEQQNAISLVPDANREYLILAGRMETGTATAEDFQRVLDALNAVLEDHTSPAISEAVAALSAMQSAASAAAGEIAQVGNEAAIAAGKVRDFASAQAMRDSTREALDNQREFIGEQDRLNALTADQLALETEIVRVRRDAADAGTVVDVDTAARIARERLVAEDSRRRAGRSGRGGRGGASEIDREREAVVKLIEAMEFELSILGLTDLEREKAQALRKAGAAATAEQRAQIEGLAEALYLETEAMKESEDALKRIQALSKTVLSGLFDDLRQGASAADLLANALNRVAESLITSGIDNLVSALTNGGTRRGGLLGGFIIPGVLHGGGVAGRDGYAHGRPVPASVFAGAPRLHDGGWIGPGEVPAILQRGERVIPRGEGMGGVTVNQTMNFAPGTDASVLRREAERIKGETIAAIVKARRESKSFLA